MLLRTTDALEEDLEGAQDMDLMLEDFDEVTYSLITASFKSLTDSIYCSILGGAPSSSPPMAAGG